MDAITNGFQPIPRKEHPLQGTPKDGSARDVQASHRKHWLYKITRLKQAATSGPPLQPQPVSVFKGQVVDAAG